MATLMARQLYIEQFKKGLLECISTAEGNQHEIKNQNLSEALTDAFSQALSALEERFEGYTQQMINLDGDESQLMKAKKVILASETSKRNLNMQRQFCITSANRHVHREALKNCFKKIKDVIDLQTTTILDELISKDILSVSDQESIRGHGNRMRQNEELLGCLIGSISVEDFHNVLLPALKENHPSLVDALVADVERLETENEEKLCTACRARRDVQVKRIATNLLSQKHIAPAMYLDLKSRGLSNRTKWSELRVVPDKAVIDAMEVRYPDFYRELMALENPSLACRCVVDNGKESLDLAEIVGMRNGTEGSDNVTTGEMEDDGICSQDDSDIEIIEAFCNIDLTNETAYKMTARPRGICLIINNNEIQDRFKRYWSDNDRENLERVFTKLDFKVITRTDLTAEQMLSEVDEVANLDHSRFDAFVCCILTYGNEQGLFGYDGEIIQDSLLTSPFKSSQCPTLAGKPKMFFIQANRLEMTEARPTNGSNCIAENADFLFGYCTFPSTGSFVTREGSFYVSALTKMLETYCDRDDILTIMRMVNQEMAKQKFFIRRNWFEQTPAPVFTLTKDVFLTSNPCWPHVPSE